MMQDQIIEIMIIAKYVLIALAIVGLIVLALGIHQHSRGLIEKGVYIIILSLVLGVCGYILYEKTKERVHNTYIFF